MLAMGNNRARGSTLPEVCRCESFQPTGGDEWEHGSSADRAESSKKDFIEGQYEDIDDDLK